MTRQDERRADSCYGCEVIGTVLWCWWQVPARRFQPARRGASSLAARILNLISQFSNVISQFPLESIGDVPKKHKAPQQTGKREPILVRLQPAQLLGLACALGLRVKMRTCPTKAIRRLLEQVLAGSQPLIANWTRV
jgi:hypothetical protein